MKYYGSLFHSDLFRMRVMTRSELLIYSALVTHGGKKREVRYSQQKIADLAGVSLGSCKRALRKFERMDWIKSASFYQIKVYSISIAEVDQSLDPGIDQSLDPGIGQSNDPPSNKEVAHSNDLGIDHSNDPGIDQSLDPHVTKNNKEEQSLHVSSKDWSLDSLLESAVTKDEILFVKLFTRWSQCSKSNWSTYLNACPLSIYRDIRKATRDLLNHSLEIKIIDSWLLMHSADRTGKHWRSKSWIKGMENWFKRQVDQGARTDINRLSARQKGFYDYSVTEMLIPEPPQTELNLDEYRKKRVAEEEEQAARDKKSLDPDLFTAISIRDYISFISNGGAFSLGNHWGNIIARCVLRVHSLDESELQEIAIHYPEVDSVHRMIISGGFSHFDHVNWLSDLLAADLTCGVDAADWRSRQLESGT